MFAQQHHLRTGEESQTVGDNVPLMSSSAEMASLRLIAPASGNRSVGSAI